MGMIFSAIGEVNAGRAAASGDRYKARVARNNAGIAEANARYAEQKGQAKEGVIREHTAQLIGEQRATLAGNNVEAGSGSALRLQTDAAAVGETEVMNQRDTAAREAYGWRAKELSYQTDEALNTWKIEQDKNRALIGYWGVGLGGTGGYSSRWDNWQSADGGGSAAAGGWADTGSTVGGGASSTAAESMMA